MGWRLGTRHIVGGLAVIHANRENGLAFSLAGDVGRQNTTLKYVSNCIMNFKRSLMVSKPFSGYESGLKVLGKKRYFGPGMRDNV